MNQILQGPVVPKVLVITDSLHFILFFVIDKVRWWSGEVQAVSGRFAIGR